MLNPAHKTNLNTLIRAAKAGHMAVMEVRERSTGATRAAICAVGFDGREYAMTPFALMLEGNPFDELDPPDSSTPDGFHGDATSKPKAPEPTAGALRELLRDARGTINGMFEDVKRNPDIGLIHPMMLRRLEAVVAMIDKHIGRA